MISKAEINFVRSLQQRKIRYEHGLFVAETPKVVNDIFDSGLKLHNLFYTDINAIPAGLEGSPLVSEVSASELERISSLTTPNRVLALFHLPETSAPDESKPFIIADLINDPGNLGTILRTADWFGYQQVLCPPDAVDAFNSKTVQSTMGSIARVRVYYRSYAEIAALLSGHHVFSADAGGEDLHSIEVPALYSLVVGSESHGISTAMKELTDEFVSIEKHSAGIGPESLNASVAAAICMFYLKNKTL